MSTYYTFYSIHIISSVLLPPACRKYLHVVRWFDIAKTEKNSDTWRSKSTVTLTANFQPEWMSESRYYVIYIANTLWKMSNWFQLLKLPRGTTLLWKNSSLSLSSCSLCQCTYFITVKRIECPKKLHFWKLDDQIHQTVYVHHHQKCCG